MARIFVIGGDDTGKTSTFKYLSEKLEKPYVKLPYGSDNDTEKPVVTGLKLRELLNDKEHPCDPTAFQALQYVNKLEAIPVIKKLEAEHGVVFIDRSQIDAVIYGDVDGVDHDLSEMLMKNIDKELSPTLVFYFRGKPFLSDKVSDIYSEKQEKIRARYEEFFTEHSKDPRYKCIEIEGKSIKEIVLEMLIEITKVCDLRVKPKQSFMDKISTTTSVSPNKINVAPYVNMDVPDTGAAKITNLGEAVKALQRLSQVSE